MKEGGLDFSVLLSRLPECSNKPSIEDSQWKAQLAEPLASECKYICFGKRKEDE